MWPPYKWITFLALIKAWFLAKVCIVIFLGGQYYCAETKKGVLHLEATLLSRWVLHYLATSQDISPWMAMIFLGNSSALFFVLLLEACIIRIITPAEHRTFVLSAVWIDGIILSMKIVPHNMGTTSWCTTPSVRWVWNLRTSRSKLNGPETVNLVWK